MQGKRFLKLLGKARDSGLVAPLEFGVQVIFPLEGSQFENDFLTGPKFLVVLGPRADD
jgi:hypothetical protein